MASSTNNSNAGTTIGIIIVVVLAVLAGVYFMNNGTDNRLNRASDEFSEEGNLGDALREGSEEFQDRSTMERVGDSIGDAGRDLQESAREAGE